MNGVRDGYGIERTSGSTRWEGHYVDGKMHGTWGFSMDGEVSYREYRHGERIE